MASKRTSAKKVAPSSSLEVSADLFAALGDETRLVLLREIARSGPVSLARLTEHTEVTRQAVTKHLRVLEGTGLVESKRDGRESLWRVKDARFEQAKRYLALIERQWDDAIDRLKTLIEE